MAEIHQRSWGWSESGPGLGFLFLSQQAHSCALSHISYPILLSPGSWQWAPVSHGSHSFFFFSPLSSFILLKKLFIFNWKIVKVLVHQSCSTLCNRMDCSPSRSYPWNSPGRNTGVGCHALLWGSSGPRD